MVIMGLAGAGKSAFVASLCNDNKVEVEVDVGHGLDARASRPSISFLKFH